MSSRGVVALGLVAGVVTAVVLVAAFIAFAPEVPLSPSTPAPVAAGSASPAGATGSPGGGAPGATPTGGPSGLGAPGGSAAASPIEPGPTSSPPAVPSTPASSPAGSNTIGAAFHVGDSAPALMLPQVGGGQIDLGVLRGRPVWIEFMATWCPSCRDDFPLMNGFAARYASQGLVVVAVDVKEDEGAAAAFANSLNASFPIGLDQDGSAASRWDVAALPVHFFVDSAGIIRDGAIGGIGPDLMAQSLRRIMPGVAVTP
jgi:thiol-disulfide isomerase/thioredoxin